ncbi:DUF1659 domain-containing protein [Bacillus massiliglaciei]|uniref:DUF1659 domain-containing protein n=1 Tax=Bacillus massiliglaciei TaxID=1816693 RepID=UPI000DA63307|nr:DUF1659 domain-containing protein [Bacillus massiliglaciei]
MASQVILTSALRLDFEAGVNEKGEAVYKRKSFANIKTNATPDQLFATAGAIAGLQGYPLSEVSRQDTHALIN